MLLVNITLIICICFVFLLGLYPLLIWLMSSLFPNNIKKDLDYVKPVSIIIASYNEEKYVKQKLESLLHPEEWIPGSEIIIYSCGSNDNTNKILNEFKHNIKIRIFIKEEHLSKINIINSAVKKAKHDLLVFSDVRQKMKKGSIKHLVNNFNDPDVGTVTCILNDYEKHNRFSLRTILNFTSIYESKMNSCSNVFGALYAQRKTVFRDIPPGLLFDDLFVVISTLSQNKRLIMDENVVLYELPFIKYYITERIQRLTRGLLLCLFQERKKIGEIPFITRMKFLIFKYFKLILPFILIIIGIDSIFLFNYYFSLNLLCLFSFILVLILLIRKSRQICFHFVKINYFFLLSTIRFFLMNARSNSWEKHIRYISYEKINEKEFIDFNNSNK